MLLELIGILLPNNSKAIWAPLKCRAPSEQPERSFSQWFDYKDYPSFTADFCWSLLVKGIVKSCSCGCPGEHWNGWEPLIVIVSDAELRKRRKWTSKCLFDADELYITPVPAWFEFYGQVGVKQWSQWHWCSYLGSSMILGTELLPELGLMWCIFRIL